MARQPIRQRSKGLDSRLTPRARAVMKAFQDARHYAPGFVVSCGVLPEVSESATDRLHTIVRELSERHLSGRRLLMSLQRMVRQKRNSDTERIERSLTELMGSEATAAYLLGLSVGLSIQALPERLNHFGR
jgi:hypothetical protein